MNYNRILAERESPVLNRLQEIESRGASRFTEWKGPSMAQCSARLDWLSSSILHDLRNPVATIYASTEMLMNSDVGPSEMKRLAANMHRAAARMREWLTEVSCAISGNKSAAEICEISEVITAAAEAASASTEHRNVRVSLDVPRGIEVSLARSRIERVFFNLIINAFEAMPGGGEVRICARQTGNYVVVEIEDTGPGLPNEIRERIFHPFVTAGKANGLGLGLSLSRQAILDHGGDLWIETALGARFVMRFPLNRVQECRDELHPIVRSR
jgi:signal transduction histidine kinase